MKIKAHLRNGAVLIATDVEETHNDQVDGYSFFVATNGDGDNRLVVSLNEMSAVEFDYDE